MNIYSLIIIYVSSSIPLVPQNYVQIISKCVVDIVVSHSLMLGMKQEPCYSSGHPLS